MLFSVEYHRHVTIVVCLWKSNDRLHKSRLDIEGLKASTKGDREMHIGTWIYEACISMHVPYKRHSDAYTPYIRLSTSDDLSNIGLAIYVNFSYR